MSDHESNSQLPPAPVTNESLPPVEPPSAGFFTQLFVIPMVIVAIIVMATLAFSWIGRRGTDPQKLIENLNRGSASSWQKALDVANLLNDQNNAKLRQHEGLAKKLQEMLEAEIKEGSTKQDRIQMRVFLCSALGLMERPTGLSVLIQAAEIEEEINEVEVRMAAVVAISRRIEREVMSPESAAANKELMAALLKASSANSDDLKKDIVYSQLRSVAAYSFGIIGGEQSTNELAILLSDPRAIVRYNSATALARHGDERCVERLLEMLDPDTEMKSDLGKDISAVERTEVIRNAITACSQLLEKNPTIARKQEIETAISEIASNQDTLPTVKNLILIKFPSLN